MSDQRMDLADIVRARRIALGLRQRELADLAGCSEPFVGALEAGKRSVRLDKVLDLCSVLGLDLEVVWGDGSLVASPAVAAAGRPDRRRVHGLVRRT